MPDAAHKVVIIGSGPAGYTAAIYAARANLSPVMFAGGPTEIDAQRVPGGQLMVTSEVENFPGFAEAIKGPELMDRMQKQAERFDTRIYMENVVKVDLSKHPFYLEAEGRTCHAQTVIISTGAAAKWLNVKGEDRYKNRGVSACATCDGFFFKNQDVLVVGGGDTAMEEATYLSKIVRHVTVLHRRDSLRASKIMQERAFSNPKISFLWNSEIEEIIGDDRGMNSASIHNLETGQKHTVMATGLFVAIGHKPNTELFQGILETNPNGYLVTQPGSTKTAVEGVYACGDVQDPYYRQAVTAAGTGCMASIDAERWLTERGLA